MKKYIFSLSVGIATCLCVASPLLSSFDSRVASYDHQMEAAPVDPKLSHFFDSLKSLQQQGLLDGEVLVARGSQILLDLKSKEISDNSPKEDPQFMIGSVSKQFFATALLKALYDTSLADTDEAKIADVKSKLQLPIAHFLPEDNSVWNGEMPDWAKVITLHQLLSHTSGIFNYSDSEGFEYGRQLEPGMKFFEFPHASADIIQLVSNLPLEFAPGTKFSYSNTGYMLIADVIESVTSMSVSEYMQQAILDPIGLKSTLSLTTGRLNELPQDPNCARLVPEGKFDPLGNQNAVYPPLHFEDISVAKGAASLISTAPDLLKWNQALHKDKTVLPESLYQLLISENLEGYAYGLGIDKNKLGKTFGHTGVIGSYRSFLMYSPEEDISVIVLANISYDWHKANKEIEAVADSMQDRIHDEEERFAAASDLVMEHHPITRGYERIMATLQQTVFH